MINGVTIAAAPAPTRRRARLFAATAVAAGLRYRSTTSVFSLLSAPEKRTARKKSEILYAWNLLES